MDQDPPREPILERVERADGRYVLYYAWPEADADPEAAVPDADPANDE
jgi:hypothetical protein